VQTNSPQMPHVNFTKTGAATCSNLPRNINAPPISWRRRRHRRNKTCYSAIGRVRRAPSAPRHGPPPVAAHHSCFLHAPVRHLTFGPSSAVDRSASHLGATSMSMLGDLSVGTVLLAIGVILVLIGLPKKGVSPRFLRFDAAAVLYPGVVMVFLAMGVAMMLRTHSG
jgi:hypothetical protein